MLKPMNNARYCAAVTVMNSNGYIYVAGGLLAPNNHTNSVEFYDPNKDEWVQLDSMKKFRSGFALIQSSGFLYAVGHAAAIERYDPWRARWTEVRTENRVKTFNTQTNTVKMEFQVRSFNECAYITSAIEIEGKILAVMRNGKIGQIKFDENGACSFAMICTSKYASTFGQQHYLYQN